MKYDDNQIVKYCSWYFRTALSCHKCGQSFKIGDECIRGGYRGKIKLYHKNCFKRY